jgi:hypothetical protein
MATPVTIFNGQYSVDVNLDYNYITSNTWSCLPGYLKAKSGTWMSWKTHQRIKLFDEKGIEILVLEDVPVNVYTGDPLPHLVGKGPGSCITPTSGGVLVGEDVQWQF